MSAPLKNLISSGGVDEELDASEDEERNVSEEESDIFEDEERRFRTDEDDCDILEEDEATVVDEDESSEEDNTSHDELDSLETAPPSSEDDNASSEDDFESFWADESGVSGTDEELNASIGGEAVSSPQDCINSTNDAQDTHVAIFFKKFIPSQFKSTFSTKNTS